MLPKDKGYLVLEKKTLSVQLEEVLLSWVYSRRERGLRVSGKFIMKKVKLIFCVLKPGESSEDKRDEQFQASRAWPQNFMRKQHISLRRKTSVAQKDPEKLVSKLVMYVLQVRRLQEKNQYSANNIIAMDESR